MMEQKKSLWTIVLVALLLGVITAFLVGSVIAQGTGPVIQIDDADDVVKISKIVNYKDTVGNNYPGVRMNIVVFKKKVI